MSVPSHNISKPRVLANQIASQVFARSFSGS